MNKIYMIIDEGKIDTFVTVRDTIEEANKEAERQWYHMTAAEKKKRRVYVAFTLPTTDFYDKAELEFYGTEDFDPTDWHSVDVEKGMFDSKSLK